MGLCNTRKKTKNSPVKLIDFGRSEIMQAGKGTSREQEKCSYLSPEVVNSQNATTATDIYSLGMVLWEARHGKPLIAPKGRFHTIDQIKDKVTQGVSYTNSEPKDNYATQYDALIQRCLHTGPTQRPTLDEIIKELGDTQKMASILPSVKE